MKILVATLIPLLAGCVSLVHEPRFTSFSANHPPVREHYPPTVPWGTPAPAQISGFDLMFGFEGQVPAGQHVVQQLVIVGARDPGCTGGFVVFNVVVREYFRTPAFDLQSQFFAAEQRRFETRRGWVALAPLPGAPPPIPAGHNAAVLDDAYFTAIGGPAAAQLVNSVVNEALGEWRLDHEYDGCHPPEQAATTCRSPHCLSIWFRTRPSANESFGSWDHESWSEEGSQW